MTVTTTQATAEVEALIGKLMLGPEGRRDPHALCTRLRELGPVHGTRHGLWFTTTYRETRIALRDERFTRGDINDRARRDPRLAGSRLFEWERSVLPFIDPPQHTRLRRLIGSALTVEYMAAQAPVARQYADHALRRRGRLDLVADLAAPLPFWLTAELLGIPERDRAAMHEWTLIRASSLQRMTASTPLEPTNAALVESEAYLLDLIERRRHRPSDDLLTRLITTEVAGDRLTDTEIAANVNQLFSAGMDTVKYLIGNAFDALLRNPEEMERLRRDPSLAANAIEETLRYEGGMTIAPARVLSAEVTLAGHAIPAEAYVIPIMLSANRDPARYEQPDRFWIARPHPRPLTFGGGIHRCLGAVLARVQAQQCLAAFAALAEPARLLPDECRYSTDIGRRGPDRLAVTIG